MHRQWGKRDAGVVVPAKKSRGASFGDGDREGDENAQFCNRIGCRGRIKYTQNTTKLGRSTWPTRKYSASDCVMANTGKLPPESKGKLPSESKRKLPSQPKHAGTKSRLSSDVQVTSCSRRLTESNSKAHEESGKVNVLERRIPVASSDVSSGITFHSTTGSRNLNASLVAGNGSYDRRSYYSSLDPSYSGKATGASSSAPSVDVPSGSTTSSSSASPLGSQRTVNSTRRKGFSSRGNGRNDSSAGMSHVLEDGAGATLGRQRLFHLSSIPPASCSAGFTLSSRDLLHNYDMNGAAEILLALEGIEQDEEQTHEQVLFEMSLFLNGLAPFDQHRDMRLDIDGMSYEELLALGERMGTVNTPLSEEELSRCLKRSVYLEPSIALDASGSNADSDDAKCSICQEEYVTGDLIGTLSECCHDYHEACVFQWLRLKNWCPVCKASAASSSSSS